MKLWEWLYFVACTVWVLSVAKITDWNPSIKEGFILLIGVMIIAAATYDWKRK